MSAASPPSAAVAAASPTSDGREDEPPPVGDDVLHYQAHYKEFFSEFEVLSVSTDRQQATFRIVSRGAERRELRVELSPTCFLITSDSAAGELNGREFESIEQVSLSCTRNQSGVNCFFNDKPLRQWEDVDSDLDDKDEGPSIAKPLESERWRTVDPAALVSEAAASLKPGQICAYAVCQDPKISIIPEFLSSGEAAALLACALPEEERQPAPRALLEAIENRMAVAAGLPLEHMDPLRVARCEPGMTPDGQVLAHGQYSQRFGARVVYVFLNTVSAGGELRFPRFGMQVKATERCAVVWRVMDERGEDDPRAVHQGRPPRRETRFCAVGVFRACPVRSAGLANSEE